MADTMWAAEKFVAEIYVALI